MKSFVLWMYLHVIVNGFRAVIEAQAHERNKENQILIGLNKVPHYPKDKAHHYAIDRLNTCVML